MRFQIIARAMLRVFDFTGESNLVKVKGPAYPSLICAANLMLSL